MQMAVEVNNFVIYLNELSTSELIKKDILKIYPNSQVYCVDNFDNFYKYISANHVDCFIFAYNLEKVSADSIVEKLRESKKFCKSVIAFFAESDYSLTKEHFSSIDINFILNNRMSNREFECELKLAFQKYHTKIIPAEFNVLIMDDTAEIREIIANNLEEMGHHQYRECGNVKDALKLIANEEFDIMLLDWNLPDGSCIDLIENIKIHSSSKRNQNALIVVITGRSDVEDIMTLLRYNVVDHIIKPFNFEEFEEKLVYALERRKKG